jgi:tRNA pseudouridine55 synthase
VTSPERSGLVIVDKPAGRTSHDVVARIRALAGTRRVGHAGTLDPMATGVLVLGVGQATRLLTYLVGADKEYLATVRLGVRTITDDAEGSVVARRDASGLEVARVEAAMHPFRGEIDQVPSAVSAVKVGGRRAYARVRAGEEVALPPRRVQVRRFDLLDARAGMDEGSGVLDLDVVVECSSGTYVRALARDLGEALDVGGHLTSLRRTRAGRYTLDAARTLDQLADSFDVQPLGEAARQGFPSWELDEDAARRLSHGQRLPASPPVLRAGGPVAAFGPDGRLVALVVGEGPTARPVFVVGGSELR